MTNEVRTKGEQAAAAYVKALLKTHKPRLVVARVWNFLMTDFPEQYALLTATPSIQAASIETNDPKLRQFYNEWYAALPLADRIAVDASPLGEVEDWITETSAERLEAFAVRLAQLWFALQETATRPAVH